MSAHRRNPVVRTALVVLFLGVGLAACGGGGDEAATTTTTTTAPPETTTTTAAVFDPGDSTDTTDTTDSGGGSDQQAAIDDFTNGLTDEIAPEQAAGYTFATISDDTGQLTVEAPAEWTDVDGRTATLGNITLPDVRASTDLEAYNTTYAVPGFEFRATSDSSTGDPGSVLDVYAERTSEDCDRLDRQAYADPLYTGVSQTFTNCGAAGAAFVWTVVQPIDTSDGDYIAVVGVQILSDADIDALGHILDTFVVTPA